MAITRKIQLTGRSTYTISLPRDWVDRMKIEQGDELNILEMEEGNLLISKEIITRNLEKEVSIDLDEIKKDSLLEKMIISKYLAGYSKITLHSKKEITQKIGKKISATVNNLIGSEIISEGPKYVEIRDLALHGEFPIDKALRRAHLIARNMQKNAVEDFIESNSDNVEDIEQREKSVDRLYFLIRREISSALENPVFLKELEMKPREVLYVYPVAKSLEKIADHCESIAHCSLGLGGKNISTKNKEYFLEYSEKALHIHTKAIQGFLSKKMDLAIEAIKRYENIQEELNSKTLVRKRSEDIDVEVQIQLAERNLDRICGYGLDIAEMAIDRIQ
ncbi:MAG: PhoU domain-containing protein [Asgard group archaeon]|nr:PhoU domain-containing protein [Asgard group archaeon]